ncbi:hypothetical protein Lal_00043270 [Lupinus albus]|nr:hypothetical protein Lal_00043270 [Lupinus albus]
MGYTNRFGGDGASINRPPILVARDKRKKGISLKASTSQDQEDGDDDESDSDIDTETMTLLVRKFNKFLREGEAQTGSEEGIQKSDFQIQEPKGEVLIS